jgi:PAS domain S-box-containing protein
VNLPRAEVLGKKITDLFHGESAVQLAERTQHIVTTRAPLAYDNTVMLKGQRRDFHIIKFPLFDAEGRVEQLAAMALDMTESKMTEEALRLSEQRYRSLFENSVVGIFQSTAAGHYILANPALATMLGYTVEELLAVNIPKDLYVEPTRRTQLQAAIADGKLVAGEEVLLKKKNGEQIVVNIYSRATTNAQGQITGYEGLALDVTERKRIEDELRRNEERLRQQAAELSIINNISQAAASQLQLDALIELVGEAMRQIFHAQRVYVALYDHAQSALHFCYDFDQGKRLQNMTLPLSDTLAARMIESRQALLINESFTQHFAALEVTMRGTPPQSYLGVPILVSDEIIGVISVQNTEREQAFTPADVRLLMTIAASVGVTVQRVRLFETIQRQLSELKVLQAVAALCIESDNEDHLLTHVTQVIANALFKERCAILLIDPTLNALTVHASAQGVSESNKRLVIPLGQGITGAVALRGQPRRIADVRLEPTYIVGSRDNLSELCVPIKSGERVIGVINVESVQLNAFSEADEQLLVAVAGQLATALERLRAEAALRRVNAELEQRVQERTEALAALRESEEQLRAERSLLRTVIDHLPAIVFVKDLEKRFVISNTAHVRWLGLTHEADIIGKTVHDFYPAAQAQLFERTDQEVLDTRQGQIEREYAVRNPAGQLRWHVTTKLPLSDSAHNVIGLVTISHDITERKQTEEALRENAEWFAKIFQASPVALSLSTLAEGRFLDVNDSFSRLLGFTRDEVLGRTAVELGTWADLTERASLLRLLREHGAVREMETHFRTKAGETRDTLLSAELIELGRQPCILGLFYDITERKKIAAREKALLQGLRAVVEATDELLEYDDLNTFYRRAVELAREKLNVERCAIFLLDSSGETLLGTYGTDEARRTTDERQVRISAAIYQERFQASGARWYVDWHNPQTTLDGDHIKTIGTGWIATTVIRTATQALGIFCNDTAVSHAPLDEVVQESVAVYCSLLGHISERKRAEETMRQSLKEKEVLLKEVHHRVKNNLQIISSLLNLQASAVTDPQVREIFHESQNRVRAMALVHEKLYQSTDLAHIHLGDYIRHLTDYLFRAYSRAAQSIRLDVVIDDVALSVDVAVPCGLLVNELVSNALKHAFPNGRAGVIRVVLRETSPQQFSLVVQDDGVGMPADFEWQHTTSLGLQLVVSLVNQLAGELQLDHRAGVTFTIQFAVPP